jgi:hypothetical protein
MQLYFSYTSNREYSIFPAIPIHFGTKLRRFHVEGSQQAVRNEHCIDSTAQPVTARR